MGDITLGCLLGQYGGVQSFDVASAGDVTNIGSWFKPTVQNSIYFHAGTDVHSSAQGLAIDVFSDGSADPILLYYCGYGDDLLARWSPDVATHTMKFDVWARMANTGGRSSGDAYVHLDAGPGGVQDVDVPVLDTAIGAAGAAAHLRASVACVTSYAAYPVFGLERRAFTGSGTLYMDDLLPQIDWISLHPTYDAAWQQRLLRGQARTQGGELYSTLWGRYFAYTLPLQFLPDSHASLLNWWWANQFNLCLTLDTSDSESLRLVRIVNDAQPIGRRMAPYPDLWQGVLQLESLDAGSLVY